MELTYAEACTRVTAPGERFETEHVEIGGVTFTAFKHAPRSLGQVFATARARGEEIFLVYEDDRWTLPR